MGINIIDFSSHLEFSKLCLMVEAKIINCNMVLKIYRKIFKTTINGREKGYKMR